jgi:hypothetical protein
MTVVAFCRNGDWGKSKLFKPLRMQEDTQPILSASTTRRAKLEKYDAVPREEAEKPEAAR